VRWHLSVHYQGPHFECFLKCPFLKILATLLQIPKQLIFFLLGRDFRPFLLEISSSSVVLLFLGYMNVSQNTFLGLFWPTGSYLADGMRMTVSTMFFVELLTNLVFLVVIGWYFPSILVGNFGIVDLAGTPFSLKGGQRPPF
jgi:hypothetical protein